MLNFTIVSHAGEARPRMEALKPGFAIVICTALVVALGLWLRAAGHELPIVPALLLPVFVGAFCGGMVGGLFAAGLALAVDLLVLRQLGSQQFAAIGGNAVPGAALFLACGLAVSGLGEWFLHLGRRVRNAAEQRSVLEREITRRGKLEECLLRSQRTIRGQLAEIECIYATAPIGLCMVDRDLRVVRVNRQLLPSGELPEAQIGRTVSEVMPELSAVLVPLVRRVMVSGEPSLDREVETVRPRDGGDRVWIASCVPLRDADGNVSGVNIAVRDVTERKRFDATLRESEEKYRLLAELSPHCIWMTDPTGTVVYANRRWLDYTGMTLGETRGRGWLSIVHPDERKIVNERFLTALRDGSRLDLELRLRCSKSGEHRWHILRAVPMRGRFGMLTGWLGVS